MPLMPVRAFVFLALSLIGASTWSVAAQETDEGREEFLRSCAVCHSPDGSGLGPMASKLQVKPSDLRRLAKRNGGVYSPDAVYQKIDGRKAPNLHAGSEMPIWGCRQMAQSGARRTGFDSRKSSKSTRGARWRLLNRSRYSKTNKKGRKKNRLNTTQAESFLDMPCDSESVIHDRIQSVVDYLRTIQVK
jgi:hypothetical protein